MSKIFDPDDDPSQAHPAARDPLGEPDAIRAEAEAAGKSPPIPRDAATLILYRLDDDSPRILMGCRSEGHDFMPNKYVFPGGRVDEEDADAPSLTELSEEQDRVLRLKSLRPPRAFPLAAIREMFEETGLIVGKPSRPPPGQPASWSDYYAQGVAPCLQPFTLIGRAITPPMRHKRFDARFFMADAREALIDDRKPVDGAELNDLRWFTLKEAAELDLPNVTRFVVSEIEARLIAKQQQRPFYLYWSEQGHVRERL